MEGCRGFAFGFVFGSILGFLALLLLLSACPCLLSPLADLPLQFTGPIRLYLGQHRGFSWSKEEEASLAKKVTPFTFYRPRATPLYRRRASRFSSLGTGSTPIPVPSSPCTSVGSNEIYSGILIVELHVLIFDLYCVV